MSLKEVENRLVWKVQCQQCEANMSARGMKSVPLADDFITKHSGETGHTRFGMDVLSHTICIEVIEGKPCGKN